MKKKDALKKITGKKEPEDRLENSTKDKKSEGLKYEDLNPSKDAKTSGKNDGKGDDDFDYQFSDDDPIEFDKDYDDDLTDYEYKDKKEVKEGKKSKKGSEEKSGKADRVTKKGSADEIEGEALEKGAKDEAFKKEAEDEAFKKGAKDEALEKEAEEALKEETEGEVREAAEEADKEGKEDTEAAKEADQEGEEDKDAAEKNKDEDKKKSSPLPIILCVLIACAGIGIGAYQIYSIQHEYVVAAQEYEKLNQYTKTVEVEVEEASQEPQESVEEVLEEDVEEEEKDTIPRNFIRSTFPNIEVDFEGLSSVNPDIVGWLYVGAVDMSYPIVQGDDNEYYLHYTFENAENCSGCVFMDSEVNPDLTSWNTFIYGHNMKNGTMFGSLKKFLREEGLYETDPYIYIFKEEGIYRYKIFSFYLDKPESKMYSTCNTFKEYRHYLNKAKEMSDYECNVEATADNNMVTLVTCSGTGASKKREFVHGIFVDRYLYE